VVRARPKCDALKFSNDHFSAAVAYRLHHRQPSFIEGSNCNCKNTPLLDELGHHISTACGQGGHRIMTHDSVKFCIKDLQNSCGIKTRVEVAECFRVANPENNQRPLMLYNAPDFNKPVVADVCMHYMPNPSGSVRTLITLCRAQTWMRSSTSQIRERNQI
jgi:hypothetical protein